MSDDAFEKGMALSSAANGLVLSDGYRQLGAFLFEGHELIVFLVK